MVPPEPPRTPLEPHHTSAGARMKAGVVGSNFELGPRTEQCSELESTGARIKIRKENQLCSL